MRIFQLNIPLILIKLLKITIFDLKTQNFFGDIVCETISYREKNNVKRNDLLEMLMDLKNDKKFAKNHDDVKNAGKDLRKFLDQVGIIKDSKKPEISKEHKYS